MNMVVAAPAVLAMCAMAHAAAGVPADPRIMAVNTATAFLCEQMGILGVAEVAAIQAATVYTSGHALLTNFCQERILAAPRAAGPGYPPVTPRGLAALVVGAIRSPSCPRSCTRPRVPEASPS